MRDAFEMAYSFAGVLLTLLFFAYGSFDYGWIAFGALFSVAGVKYYVPIYKSLMDYIGEEK